MVLVIDLTGLPSRLRSIVADEINAMKESSAGFNINITMEPENETTEATDTEMGKIEEIKRRLKDVLLKNKVRDYIVVSDPGHNAKIKILERNLSQNSAAHHCTHCGMEFEDEIQFSIHHRIHFLI
jgi:hypothetical protein